MTKLKSDRLFFAWSGTVFWTAKYKFIGRSTPRQFWQRPAKEKRSWLVFWYYFHPINAEKTDNRRAAFFACQGFLWYFYQIFLQISLCQKVFDHTSEGRKFLPKITIFFRKLEFFYQIDNFNKITSFRPKLQFLPKITSFDQNQNFTENYNLSPNYNFWPPWLVFWYYVHPINREKTDNRGAAFLHVRGFCDIFIRFFLQLLIIIPKVEANFGFAMQTLHAYGFWQNYN